MIGRRPKGRGSRRGRRHPRGQGSRAEAGVPTAEAEAAAEAAAAEAEALAEAGAQEAIADAYTADVVAFHIPAVVRAQTLESDCQHPGSNDAFIGHVGKSIADAASSVSGYSVGAIADAASHDNNGYSVGSIADAASSVSGYSGAIADAASSVNGYSGGSIAETPPPPSAAIPSAPSPTPPPPSAAVPSAPSPTPPPTTGATASLPTTSPSAPSTAKLPPTSTNQGGAGAHADRLMGERRSALDTLLGHALEAHPLEMLPPHILASRVQAGFRFRSPPLLSIGGGRRCPRHAAVHTASPLVSPHHSHQ